MYMILYEVYIITFHQAFAQKQSILLRLSGAPQYVHYKIYHCSYWKGNLYIKGMIIFVVIDDVVWYTHKSWSAY